MNNRVRLNTKLITTLSDVLFIATPELIKTASIPSSTWYRILADTDLITIQHLLALSNSLHVPVRRFFSRGSADIIGKREYYIVENFKTCYYDDMALSHIIGDSNDLTWKKAAEATGISYYNLRKSLTAERRTPVNRFLLACEALGIDPFRILIDPNKEGRGKKPAERSTGEVKELRSKIDSLTTRVDELTEKYQRLLDAHNFLVRRINNQLGGTTRKASEPDGED